MLKVHPKPKLMLNTVGPGCQRLQQLFQASLLSTLQTPPVAAICEHFLVQFSAATTFFKSNNADLGRCPARGFQHQLHHPAPRSHLGTACCTAGSGPGPPPCRAPSSDGLSGCAVARFRLRACRPQQTCLGQGPWTPGAGKRAFLGFTGSPQQLRSGHGQEGIDGRTVGD